MRKGLRVGQFKLSVDAEMLLFRLLKRMLESGVVANNGPLVQSLEARLAETLGVQHVVATSSGTMGLLIALQTLKIVGGTGDVVILPAWTFLATAQAVLAAGLRCVFCDVDPISHVMSASSLRTCLDSFGNRVFAVIAVHLWGQKGDEVSLHELCEKFHVPLVTDSAQAFGSEVSNSLSMMQVYSLHATKLLSSAEGGCIATNDSQCAHVIRCLRDFGRSPDGGVLSGGLNGKMSEVHAAIALSSLLDLDDNIRHCRMIHREFRNRFHSSMRLRAMVVILPLEQLNCCPYVVAVASSSECRVWAVEVLRVAGVAVSVYYRNLAQLFPTEISVDLSVTKALQGRCFVLPTGRSITIKDVDFIVSSLEKAKSRL